MRSFSVWFREPKALAIVLVLSLLFLGGEWVGAGGLRTTFTEVTLHQVQIGQSVRLRVPLTITNTGATSTRIKVDAVKPAPVEILDGYEAIPDPSWIRFERDTFTVEPNETEQTVVILDVPYDVAVLGKRYQVTIYSRSISGMIGVGFRSRVLFSIDSVVEY